MADSIPPAVPADGVPYDRIEDFQIEQELQDSYLTYAMSTIMDRALPDVRDGLKPSQRRILVAMNDLNLVPGRKHLKCAKIAGDTSGNYHPHGDAVIYPALVRMAQPWSLRYPLIDGQGNFGSTDGDPPAAMRYTEARMGPPAVELLEDLKLDTVDFQPNYDERPGLDEPTVLPAKFPNLLVNGSTGIAVGMACNLLPHNLNEICDAIVATINNPEIAIAELLEIVPGPDFPTGGIICGRDGIVDGYTTGRGRVCLRAKISTEEQKNGRTSVIVDELPYGIIRRSIVESVAEAVKKDLIRDISAINDESGRKHAVRIVIDLKRDADPNVVIRQLYEYTPCQITVSMINIALVNRQPRTMGLKELIQHFIAHRKEVITRRTKFQLRKAQQREHIVTGLMIAQFDIDEVIRTIRTSKTRDEAIAKLMQMSFGLTGAAERLRDLPPDILKEFLPSPLHARLQNVIDAPGSTVGLNLSRAQAEAIGRLQLIQLVGLEFTGIVKEYNELRAKIDEYEKILRDEPYLMDIIREDTIEMKEKHGDKRRTEITGAVSGYNMESLIAQEEVVVTVTHAGYIKRLKIDTYRAQSRGGRGIKGTESKQGDFVQHLFVANTHDYLMFFTNQGRVYERRVYDVPEMSRTSQGRSIANLLEFQPGEKIANVLAIKDFSSAEQFLMFATAKGTVKKTALSAYSNIRTTGIIAIGLEEGDSLMGVEITNGNDQILLGTKKGLAIRFLESDVRAMGRPAGGVMGLRFKRDGDEVVSMVVVPQTIAAPTDGTPAAETCMVLTACVNGYGKRTAVDEYRLQGRGGSGVINIDASDRNGEVVSMMAVCDSDDLMLITEKGILIRTKVGEIRSTGRNAQGVRLIKVADGDRLVAMAKLDADEAADEPAESPDGTLPSVEPIDDQPPTA